MSWKPYFEFPGGEWATNATAFATEAEARAAAGDRFQRWTMPISFDARESDEEVNYLYDFEKQEERHVPRKLDTNQPQQENRANTGQHD